MQANPVESIKKDIYVIKSDIDGRVYVGQSKDVDKRFVSHCKNYNRSLISDAIRTYGKNHFWYEVLEHNVSDSDEREKYWISEFDSVWPNGYNIQDGGSEPPHFYGDFSPQCVISDMNVSLLKDDLRNTNISLIDLASKYGISKRQVLRINQGLSRSVDGEDYPIRKVPNINGKLTEDDVDEIIDLLKYTYMFNGEIARRYGVEVHAISKINEGISHRREGIEYPIRKWKSCGTIGLTYDQVTDIIDRIMESKQSLRKIAKDFDIPINVIYGINSGKMKTYRRDNLQYPLRPY